MIIRQNISKVVALVGLFCASAIIQPVVGQQPHRSNSARHESPASPIHRLKQLSQRVQQRYTGRGSQYQQHQARLRSDESLKRAGHPANFQNQQPQANRIQTTERPSRNVRAGYVQEPAFHDPDAWKYDSYWPDESTNSSAEPINPIRSEQSNSYPQRTAQGSGFRNQSYVQDTRPAQQSGFQHGNYHQNGFQTGEPQGGLQNAQLPIVYEEPGVLGANIGTGEPRFSHFSSRIPASERVIRLEDELQQIQKDLLAKDFDNKMLQNKLDENERLLADSQTAIDDAITQLTDAATVNQQLRQRIAQLENENQQQKANSERLLDDVRSQLRELLAAELSGGN